MNDKAIKFWNKKSIAFIQLHRPEKANAYNQEMLLLFRDLLKKFESDKKYQVLIITGAGNRAFCSGADLNEMKRKTYVDALNLESARLFDQLAKSTKISIAAINGAACGGGLELALSCDLRICSRNATFAFPEIRHGLIPAAGGTQRLAHVVGKAMAKELILGCETWSADKALGKGLVSRMVDDTELLSEAQKWGRTIAHNNHLPLQLAKLSIDANSAGNSGFLIEKLSEALLYEIKHKE